METSTGFDIVGITGSQWSESELHSLSEELTSEVNGGFTSVVIGTETLMRVFGADDPRQLLELGLTNLTESETELPSSPESTSIPFKPGFIPPDLIPWITGWGAALLLQPEDPTLLSTENIVHALDDLYTKREQWGAEPVIIAVHYPSEAENPSFYRTEDIQHESTE
ncbi:hypothetical protein SAMN05421858_3254 [Haladaptatus litoreus]|uniref:Uncharacterized protein n=1 Tax=Haladaptatus litoreus TaxID=553468 RepID=A0A1N7CUB7_9EURY|nr:hypothetical protein [Haladaptatus litoreus]SIR67077.1 hypothetical protein SAMN05421858_3254 [Haladaptatus litoreus]